MNDEIVKNFNDTMEEYNQNNIMFNNNTAIFKGKIFAQM